MPVGRLTLELQVEVILGPLRVKLSMPSKWGLASICKLKVWRVQPEMPCVQVGLGRAFDFLWTLRKANSIRNHVAIHCTDASLDRSLESASIGPWPISTL